MSTTFGIRKIDEYGEEIEVAIAKRTFKNIRWLNDLAEYLPDNLEVEPLDNSAQGIFNIGDIKQYRKKCES